MNKWTRDVFLHFDNIKPRYEKYKVVIGIYCQT